MIIEKLIFNKHLDEGEEILFVAHKHFIAVLEPFTKNLIFGIIIPWLLYIIIPAFLWISIIWTFVSLIKLTYILTDWYCDAWLITSMSIIDLEWKGIFNQTSTRVDYGAIESVTYEIKGFFATILRYGVTELDKIGNATPTVLEYAAYPKRIELKVLEYKEIYEEKKSKQESEGLKNILADVVARHIKEKGLSLSKEGLKKNIHIENMDNKKNEFTYKNI